MKSVVIVGGGVIGLFCALRLAKAGAQVTLLEAEAESRSVNSPTASAAAAGMLAPYDAGALHEGLALRSLDLWREAQQEAAWAGAVRFDGAVYLRASEADAVALQARIVSVGRKARPLSARQLHQRFGFKPGAYHAIAVTEEGVADPLQVLSGLAFDARQHGVVIRYNQDVARVIGGAAFTHEGEVFEADAIVLAPGAWATEALLAAAPALRHVRPAKGNIVTIQATRAFEGNLHAPGFYLTRRGAETILGATMELDRFDRQPDQSQADNLLATARMFMADPLVQARVWAGVRPMSPDGWPMIGPSGDVILAAGHSRNGWTLAPVTAEIVAAHVMGETLAPEWALLSPDRFELASAAR